MSACRFAFLAFQYLTTLDCPEQSVAIPWRMFRVGFRPKVSITGRLKGVNDVSWGFPLQARIGRRSPDASNALFVRVLGRGSCEPVVRINARTLAEHGFGFQ